MAVGRTDGCARAIGTPLAWPAGLAASVLQGATVCAKLTFVRAGENSRCFSVFNGCAGIPYTTCNNFRTTRKLLLPLPPSNADNSATKKLLTAGWKVRFGRNLLSFTKTGTA